MVGLPVRTLAKVLRLRPDDTVETFADGLDAPLGLVFGPDGTLYVSSYTTGRVTAISRDGARRLVATLPGEGRPSFQYLAMDAGGSLYCPSYSDSKIWRISPVGEVEPLGVVKGGSDAGAKVQTPNSLCVRDGILWFTEFGTNSVYRCPLR